MRNALNKALAQLNTLRQSSIIRNFFIYSLGTILLRSISLLLAPLTLNVLQPRDYGQLALANNFISILVIITGFGLRQAYGIEYFHANQTQRKKHANHIIVTYMAISLPVFAVLLFNTSLINYYIFANNATQRLIIVSLASSFIYFLAEFFYQILRYQSKALQLMILQISTAILTIILNLIFLLWLKWGIYSMLLSTFIGMIFVCLVGTYVYTKKNCWSYINVKKGLAQSRYFLKLGFPFIPSMLFAWMLASGDRWVLAHYSDLHSVGIYSLADTFGQLYQMLILYPMSSSYLPALLSQFSKNKATILQVEQWNQKNMWTSIIVLTTLITVGYIACKPILYWFLPGKYHETITYVWFILMGYVLLTGTYFTTALIQFYKKTYFLMIALCLPALCNLALNIVLIPIFSIHGCVSATLISYALYFAVTLWYNKRLQSRISDSYKMPLVPSSSHLDKDDHTNTIPPQKAPAYSTSKQKNSGNFMDKNF